MKRLVLVAVIAVALSAAATADTSIGVIAGEPTGVSFRQSLGSIASFDLALAWSFVAEGSLYVHLDYQQYFREVDISESRLLFFLGIGPKVYINEEVEVGARIPVGIFYSLPNAPLEFFGELVPGVSLYPETDFDFMGAIGMRYQFGTGWRAREGERGDTGNDAQITE